MAASGQADELTCQRTLLAAPSPVIPDALYAITTGTVLERSRGRVILGPDSSVSADTYFGRFPASYWQRWSTVASVVVEFQAKGSGHVFVMASDHAGVARRVVARSIAERALATIRLRAPIDRFFDGGSMWLEAISGRGELLLSDIRWRVAAPRRTRTTSVVICTHNRAEQCLDTLEAICGEAAVRPFIETVLIVDNGSDSLESRPRFHELRAELGAQLRYLPQRNLGGSGGFARGLYEVAGGGTSYETNVLFMDDDILLEPDTIARLSAFANSAHTPVMVGAQMLCRLHPEFLYVGAEYADLESIRFAGIVEGSLHMADLTHRDADGRANLPDLRIDAAYNAWWSCLIPPEVVSGVGYPLPFFFQWDDIEYGYRARARGFSTVTLPGSAVWHPDFDWKEWDTVSTYFELRNSLITAALHTSFPVLKIIDQMLTRFASHLVSMQYGRADSLLLAVEDFLRGPDALRDGGTGAIEELRKRAAGFPETEQHDGTVLREFIDDRGSGHDAARRPAPRLERLALLSRLATHLAGRGTRSPASIRASEASWWHVSRHRYAAVTERSQTGVRIRRRDREVAVRLLRRALAVSRRLATEAPAVSAAYRAALPELAGPANWRRLFATEGGMTERAPQPMPEA